MWASGRGREGRWGGGERERRGYEDFYKERRQQRLEASERVKKKTTERKKTIRKKPRRADLFGFSVRDAD